MKKIFGLSLFCYAWANKTGNNVQGTNNFIIGTKNDVNGNNNFQISHNVDVKGNNNKLVGANYEVQGNNIHMFGPQANIDFKVSKFPIGNRVFKKNFQRQREVRKERTNNDQKNQFVSQLSPQDQIRIAAAQKLAKEEQEQIGYKRKKILQNKQSIMNKIFELQSFKAIFGNTAQQAARQLKKAEKQISKQQKEPNYSEKPQLKLIQTVQIDTPLSKKVITVVKDQNKPIQVIEKIQTVVKDSNGQSKVIKSQKRLGPQTQQLNTFDSDSFFGLVQAPTAKPVLVRSIQPKGYQNASFKPIQKPLEPAKAIEVKQKLTQLPQAIQQPEKRQNNVSYQDNSINASQKSQTRRIIANIPVKSQNLSRSSILPKVQTQKIQKAFETIQPKTIEKRAIQKQSNNASVNRNTFNKQLALKNIRTQQSARLQDALSEVDQLTKIFELVSNSRQPLSELKTKQSGPIKQWDHKYRNKKERMSEHCCNCAKYGKCRNCPCH